LAGSDSTGWGGGITTTGGSGAGGGGAGALETVTVGFGGEEQAASQAATALTELSNINLRNRRSDGMAGSPALATSSLCQKMQKLQAWSRNYSEWLYQLP